MNKLSELSKPVAWRYRYTKPGITDSNGEAWVGDWKFVTDEVNCNPAKNYQKCALYSQEYVSALLEDNERVARDLVARNGEIEGLRKRAAELEAIRADASQVFKEIGNELGCNPDNESIMMAIDALKEREKRVVALAGGSAELWETMAARLEAAEAKLATPVRLTDAVDYSDIDATSKDREVIEAIAECKGWNANRLEQAVLLKKQGFKVEGDE